jgi:peptide/nickel transport system permease protein
MTTYLLQRLFMLPITLFAIILINFVVINLAPGDPVNVTEVTQEGATKREDQSVAFGSDDRYLQFREFYGLTLPILFNTWPFTSYEYVYTTLWKLTYRKDTPQSQEEINFQDFETMRINFGDRARFIMPILLQIMEDPAQEMAVRKMAARFFVRGGIRQGFVGPNLSTSQQEYNRKITKDNTLLNSLLTSSADSALEVNRKFSALRVWYEENEQFYQFHPTFTQKLTILFFETRFYRYFSRLLRLDFGTLRNDPNKTVVSEVVKRFKYSLTLSITPMFLTFFLCQLFGLLMAYYKNYWPDYTLNFVFLILFAIPIFVVAPFLIEEIALHRHFPFTNTPIPISGFTSPDAIYLQKTSLERLVDVLQHLFLPLIAILYGTLALQSRLSRTAVLENLNQDYVRTARAKGVPTHTILFKHVGRNAGITVITSLASSLGVILAGSLIVETLFEIDGFGKFFYDAILNRDYNVIMFSALAGSFITLMGYLIADLAYTWLDPRVTLHTS